LHSDNNWKTAKQVWDHTARQIDAVSERINPEQFAATAELIVGCKGKIITTGTGTSGAAAKKVAHTLSCVERPAFFLSPAGSRGSVSESS